MRKYWNYEKGVYTLYLPPYSNENAVVSFIEDADNKGHYIFVSSMMKVEYDTIIANSIEEVQEELEYIVSEYILKKIDEWETLLDCIEKE